jgi:hypothetical protein
MALRQFSAPCRLHKGLSERDLPISKDEIHVRFEGPMLRPSKVPKIR